MPSLSRDPRQWPSAVIVGLELNGLGLARALHRRGVRCVAVADGAWTPLHASRSVKAVHRCAEWTREALLDLLFQLGRRMEQRPVLFLTKDESVLWASSAMEELAQYYRIALPKPDVVQLLMNKARFLERARESNWPVPRGFLWSSMQELERLLPDLVYPSILKPQLRNSAYRAQGLPKAFKVTNQDEVVAAYRRIARWEPEAILSEWIEGKDNTLYSCRGFWDRDGKPVVQHVARKLMQWPIEAGNMAALEIPPPEFWPEPLAIANRVFGEIGMFGVGAVEFKRHADGRYLILEPCVGRTVYSHEIGPLNGYDIPWAAFRYLATSEGPGNVRDDAPPEREAQPPPRAGRLRLIDTPRARRAEQEYLRRGTFTPAETRRVFAAPHLDMTRRGDDPRPLFAAYARAVWLKLRRVFTPGRTTRERPARSEYARSPSQPFCFFRTPVSKAW